MSKEWRKIYDDAVARIQKKNALESSKNLNRIYMKLRKVAKRMIKRGCAYKTVRIGRAKPLERAQVVAIAELLDYEFKRLNFILKGFEYESYGWYHRKVCGTIVIWTDEEFKDLRQDISIL
jgi:hypothetical protein